MKLPARAVQIYERFKPFAIHAFKGGRRSSHYPGGYFKHTFEGGGGKILGLPDGSLLLRPHKRRKLWNLFPVQNPLPRLPNKEPFLNPMTLAVVNPLCRNPAKRVPRGSLRSGAIHRRGKKEKGGWYMSKRKHYRRARRNPLGIPSMSAVKEDSMDALAVAGGLIASPFVLNFVPLPAALQSGFPRMAVKAVAAIGIGIVSGMVLGRRIGRLVGVGGLAGVGAELLASGLQRVTGGGSSPALGADTRVELTVLPTTALSAYTGVGLGAYSGMGY